ncbi:adenylylsulfate kinase [Actinoplanes campanulatus]|uniref:Adenylylsulfate kinase n=1 Tax=Actinoplanes campanulatus TaxID=113559 RepID=A0A7W5ADY6_9ACTN|nr:adenylyl-sulfate kinase [Actinoplanes campanulatus]MBB3094290.1 adenylylsulfate kinase [Actinoplanes campanulatus]GGN19952.1 adenylyl-sulfate kinase [Actinoplanes campanulatus]GID35791.1 adenylyl-sulfate kinase [Actinoplanes campanulatus]
MIVWLIGLSGAGKTTVGTRLAARLRPDLPNLVYLDGDLLRDVWGGDLSHDVAGREVNAARLSKLCLMLDRQDIHVVAAVLSIFPQWQAWNRENLSSYFEVFLDVPMDVVVDRDTKGLYRAALQGRGHDVVGVDIPFPRPAGPDLVLDSSGRDGTPDELTDRILAALHERAAR